MAEDVEEGEDVAVAVAEAVAEVVAAAAAEVVTAAAAEVVTVAALEGVVAADAAAGALEGAPAGEAVAAPREAAAAGRGPEAVAPEPRAKLESISRGVGARKCRSGRSERFVSSVYRPPHPLPNPAAPRHRNE